VNEAKACTSLQAPLASLRGPLALGLCVRANTSRVARTAGSALVEQEPRKAAGRGPPARAGATHRHAVCCRPGAARVLLARRRSRRPRHAPAPSLAGRPRLWRRACRRALVGRARSDRRGRVGRADRTGRAGGTATRRCARGRRQASAGGLRPRRRGRRATAQGGHDAGREARAPGRPPPRRLRELLAARARARVGGRLQQGAALLPGRRAGR